MAKSCIKCGGPTPATPTLIVDFDDNDLRPAKVQFRQTVAFTVNEVPRNFHTAEVFILNFSLIRVLIQMYGNCLIFLNTAERDAFYA